MASQQTEQATDASTHRARQNSNGVPTTASTGSTPPCRKRQRTKPSSAHAKPFNDMLFDFLVYRAEHKHTCVPRSHFLFSWVSMLRHEKTTRMPDVTPESCQGYLTKERIEVLDSLDFVWDVVKADSDKRWNQWFARLVEYKKENGHCNPPQRTELGMWVKVQRMNKIVKDQQQAQGGVVSTKNKIVALSQERTDKLASIGFQFRIKKPVVGWEARFEQLVEFRKKQGDCVVPQLYPPDPPFGRWVMKQRCGHTLKLKGKKTELTDERIARLNEIGFSWVAPRFGRVKADGIG